MNWWDFQFWPRWSHRAAFNLPPEANKQTNKTGQNIWNNGSEGIGHYAMKNGDAKVTGNKYIPITDLVYCLEEVYRQWCRKAEPWNSLTMFLTWGGWNGSPGKQRHLEFSIQCIEDVSCTQRELQKSTDIPPEYFIE